VVAVVSCLPRRHVVQQVFLVVLQFVETGLHDVANRDHADELSFVHDWQVAYASLVMRPINSVTVVVSSQV